MKYLIRYSDINFATRYKIFEVQDQQELFKEVYELTQTNPILIEFIVEMLDTIYDSQA